MKQMIVDEIRQFVKEDPGNRFPGEDQPYFEEPLTGFAACDDPLFAQYKTIIGDFHLTPQELIEGSAGAEVWKPRTLICWVLPIVFTTKMTNRGETTYPSKKWTQTLIGKGHNAAAPQLLRACLWNCPFGGERTFWSS